MDTKELVAICRDSCLEYDSNPVDDTFILRKLNEAYRFAYNHFVKSNDTLFGQLHPLQIRAGISEYDLPENLWGKRIEHLQIPSPPNESQTPWGWVKVEKIDYKQSYPWQSSKIKTYYPERWSQLGNKVYLFPPALVDFIAQLVISRRLAPLGILGGRIIDLGSDTITVELNETTSAINDPRIVANMADPTKAFISVSDFWTGEVKQLYAYNSASDTTGVITLCAAPTGRVSYQGYPISSLPGTDWTTAGIELDDLVTFGYTTGASIIGEAFDTFLTEWASMKIRGSLNENDPQVMESLKVHLDALKSDTAGRLMGVKMNRVVYNNIGARPVRRRV